MYITLFDQFGLLNRLPRWQNLASRDRALIAGLLIAVALLLLGGTAVATRYHYTPLIILGLFCGAVVAKVLGQFLAPKLQSHVTMFLGGVTTGNLGTSETGLRKLIAKVADEINKVVALLPQNMGDLTDPMTLALWIALLTALIILAANAYYANQESSPVGNPVPQPSMAVAPVVPIDSVPVARAAASRDGG